MSLTASTLISEAKKRTFGRQGRQKISDAALLAELAHQDSMIVQEISQTAPDLLATVTGTGTITLAENASGYTLSTGIHYRDFFHYDPATERYVPIILVQRQWQDSAALQHPAGMIRSNGTTGIFYPIDPSSQRWGTSDSQPWFEETSDHEFRYSYVPAPGSLTSLSSTLSSPDIAREAFITALELQILLANPDVRDPHIQVAVQRYSGARLSLTWQVHKFVHAAGQRPSSGISLSDARWVQENIG